MQNLRWVTAGFVIGVVVALAPSCGSTKPRCGPSNCGGCCDAQGVCQSAQTNLACGLNGAACTQCPLDQACQAGTCAPANPPPTSSCTGCAGCCGAGGCQPGDSILACGSGGVACIACKNHQECKNGTCVDRGSGDGGTCGPGNCAGCCRNNVCVTDSSDNPLNCGTGGATCDTCTGTESCVSGTCSAPGSCNASNCNGCCDGTTCVPLSGQSDTRCGSNGSACIACSGATCSNGACTTTQQGCGPGTSNPCTNGCCSGTGTSATCVAGTSDFACGKGGAQCEYCIFGEVCQNQACIAPVEVGDPCSTDSDCADLGGSYRCKKTTTSGNASYSGGYCTILCSTNSDCTANSTCVSLPGGFGEGDSMCFRSCAGSTDCRSPGYECYDLGNSVGGCWINPLPSYDAGPPADKIGIACTSDSQCINPPDDGYCIPATDTGGNPTGWPGGYCSATCFTEEHCGTDGICITFTDENGDDFNACQARCAAANAGQSTCRSGYICEGYLLALPDGGSQPSTEGICMPRCDNPGSSGCPTGSSCQSSGYCQ